MDSQYPASRSPPPLAAMAPPPLFTTTQPTNGGLPQQRQQPMVGGLPPRPGMAPMRPMLPTNPYPGNWQQQQQQQQIQPMGSQPYFSANGQMFESPTTMTGPLWQGSGPQAQQQQQQQPPPPPPPQPPRSTEPAYPPEKSPFEDPEVPEYQPRNSQPEYPPEKSPFPVTNGYDHPREQSPFPVAAPQYQATNNAQAPAQYQQPQQAAPQYTPGTFRPQIAMSSQYVGGGLRPRTMSTMSGSSRPQPSLGNGPAYPPPSFGGNGAAAQWQGDMHQHVRGLSRSSTWESRREGPYRAHSTSSSISELHPLNEKRRSVRDPVNTDVEKLISKQEELNDAATTAAADPTAPRPRLPIRQRVKHFTWAWYTWTMGTGGMALLIFAQPNTFPGLRTIGFGFYIFNLVLFALITMTMITRFILYPGMLMRSVKHKKEGFFVPTMFVSLSTMISGTHRYVIPDNNPELNWLIQTMFWTYVVLAIIASVAQYSFVFGAYQFALQAMMPTWILPIFPIMLAGTISSIIPATQPSIFATPIIVAGLLTQGLGIIISIMMYALLVGRLMTGTLPDREARPGLFICVGPPSFTALAFIGMANNIPADFDIQLSIPVLPGQPGMSEKSVIQLMAYVVGTVLWGLSFWWFSIAFVAVVRSPPRFFHLPLWGMIFPNVGFSLATITLGKSFASQPIQILGSIMSAAVALTYVFLLYFHFRAMIRQDVMYPGRDEDTDD